MLELSVGNKNSSLRSRRVWTLMRRAGIALEEVMLRFDGFSPESLFRQRAARISPARQAPVMVGGHPGVRDTPAIAEYLVERFPQRRPCRAASPSAGAAHGPGRNPSSRACPR
jgi:glutathione S-transferase